MCIGLATRLQDFDLAEVEDARSYLVGEHSQNEVETVLPAYDIYEDIDSNRKGLSHVIYIERGQPYVSGLVQFYGYIQFFCHLGISKETSKKAALLATLDPLTGEEEFSSISPLDLEEPPYEISLEELPLMLDGWLNKLSEEASMRGGINPKIKQGNSFIKENPENA